MAQQRTARTSLATLAYDAAARRRFNSVLDRLPLPSSLAELRDAALLPGFDAPQVRVLPPWASPVHPARFTPVELDARELDAHTAHVNEYAQKLRRNPWGAWRHVFAMMRSPAPMKGVLSPAQLHAHFCKTMEITAPFDPGGAPGVLFPHAVRISAADFSPEELERAVEGMTNHTAPGPDGIPVEAFRCSAFRARVLPLLNHALDAASLPSALTHGLLTPLFKGKGDASDPAGYRPVVLLPVCSKVLHKMILHRVRDAVDQYLVSSQAAYRPHRSTIQHIAALHEITSRARSTTAPVYAVFADFINAFSSIQRGQVRSGYRQPGTNSRSDDRSQPR